MKYLQSITILLLLLVMISCNNTNGSGQDGRGTDQPKTYPSPTEAANAAKKDMLDAMDQQIAFNIDKEKLRGANPAAPVMRYELQWDALLKADSSAGFAQLAANDPTTIVPLINGNEIITVIGVREDKQAYSIATLGDKQLSADLDLISRASGKTTDNIKIYEIPNLQATIYEVMLDPAKPMYFTSYNNSLRQGMEASGLLPMLRANAEAFEKQFGAEIRKGKLVR